MGNEKLKTVKTREPVSPSAVMKVELARDSSLTAVGDFDRAKLKKAETAEKNPLPSSEAIAQEMEHIKFKVGIENYDKTKLSLRRPWRRMCSPPRRSSPWRSPSRSI